MSKLVKTNFDQFAQLGNVCNSTLDIPKKLIQSKIMSELRNRNYCCMAKKIFNIIPKDVKKCHKIICECALKTDLYTIVLILQCLKIVNKKTFLLY